MKRKFDDHINTFTLFFKEEEYETAFRESRNKFRRLPPYTRTCVVAFVALCALALLLFILRYALDPTYEFNAYILLILPAGAAIGICENLSLRCPRFFKFRGVAMVVIASFVISYVSFFLPSCDRPALHPAYFFVVVRFFRSN